MSQRIVGFFCSGLMATAAMVAASPLPASAAAATYQSFPLKPNNHFTCFGYEGTFLKDSRVMTVQWYGGATNECFGIAPDRSIWHVWEGSGGWKPMPNGGLADNTIRAFSSSNPYTRYIQVCVLGSGTWESQNVNGTWNSWFLAKPGVCGR
jgi:hypothetical protein